MAIHLGLNGRMLSRLQQFLATLLIVGGLFVGAGEAAANGWYLRPNVGAAIDLDGGETDYAIGVALGHTWLGSMLATEVAYTRIFSDPDANMYEATGRIGFPFGIISPYAIVGVGLFASEATGSDTESLVRLGGGFGLQLLPIVHINAELSYINVGGDTHLLQPALVLGVTF